MKRNLEILGLRLELAGLIVVLCATFWQVFLTDWFEQQPPDWRYNIQEDVNLCILQSMQKISWQIAETDQSRKDELFEEISKKLDIAYSQAIKKRIDLENWKKGGQFAFCLTIKSILFILGACLFMIGKYLTLRHTINSNKANAADAKSRATVQRRYMR